MCENKVPIVEEWATPRGEYLKVFMMSLLGMVHSLLHQYYSTMSVLANTLYVLKTLMIEKHKGHIYVASGIVIIFFSILIKNKF